MFQNDKKSSTFRTITERTSASSRCEVKEVAGTHMNAAVTSDAIDSPVSKDDRAQQKQQKPCIIWFTGLSGSGKTTTAVALEKRLNAMGKHTYLIDGDHLRQGLNSDLSFTDQDRTENIRRVGEVAKLFVDAGLIVIVALISPFRADRLAVRNLVKKDEFIEVYMNTPLEVCEQRDVKGLYKKARSGEIQNFTGIDSRYEVPQNPDVVMDSSTAITEETVDCVISTIL